MEQAAKLQKTDSARTGKLPDNLRALDELSQNFWWSWAHEGANVFRELDPALWEKLEQNPRRMLAEISELHLWQRACDSHFVNRVNQLKREFDDYLAQTSATFGDKNSPRKLTAENPVAYFCAEYGVHNSLPLYSGGLGILAGDHLKSASDLRVPLVAVGLFYRFGYFRQRIAANDLQHEVYQESQPNDLAVSLVLDENNAPLKVRVKIRRRDVYAQVWLAKIGRVSLYLLDTNTTENNEIDRLITGHLYGGDRETRIVQEMLLGIGGVRLLRQLNIEPSVFHLNEGHSAFLTLELAREITENSEKSFADAQIVVRDKCVFTTHTPVAAGNDEFSPEFLENCFDDDYFAALKLDKADFFALGRTKPEDLQEWFGVTPFALRMCRSANGVSAKHGEVSRNLWRKMYTVEHAAEVPITSITNGVHAPTWIAHGLRDLYIAKIGADWAQKLTDQNEWTNAVNRISDEELWQAHNLYKNRLIAYIRERSATAAERKNESIETARQLFDSHVLTIGFARRVAAYKRWNLLLTDAERLLDLIDNAERPVQFVFAGKAHPQDKGAKAILQELLHSRANSTFARRAIFLEDYDQEMARYLVQGVDVWMNVPRRPLEASGTSGQKAAMNGALNFSILDGWWIEGYNERNGFAINEAGDLSENFDETEIDLGDAVAMYETLEQAVVPKFYERDVQNLPREWVAMMRDSIATMTPQFASDRMVNDYIEKIYLG